jgi:NAD(P)-dependent dehydrogenase (short-subunit alcohol dehydrogenase family)
MGRLGFAMRTPYVAAKWGVIGFTKSLSIELGPDNIRGKTISGQAISVRGDTRSWARAMRASKLPLVPFASAKRRSAIRFSIHNAAKTQR